MSRRSGEHRSSKSSTAESSSIKTFPGPLQTPPAPMSPHMKYAPPSPSTASLPRPPSRQTPSRPPSRQASSRKTSSSASSPVKRPPSHRSASTDYGDVLRGTSSMRMADNPSPTADRFGTSRSQPAALTMDAVRERVSQDIALRAVRKARVVDGTKVGVVLTLAKSSDEAFLRAVAANIKRVLLLQTFLFAVATTPAAGETSALIICGASQDVVQRAVMLACAKFLSRVEEVYNEGTRWVGLVHDIGSSSYDETALWDVVNKAAQNLVDPRVPPPGSRGIDRMLSDARARLQRITPQQAFDELQDPHIPVPVILVDIRPDAQRARSGGIHGSLLIERNVLEWRFDPRCDARLSIADRYDLRVIVFCEEGYTSSLAAAALQEIGLLNATDIEGGFAAWKEAGLPTELRFQEE